MTSCKAPCEMTPASRSRSPRVLFDRTGPTHISSPCRKESSTHFSSCFTMSNPVFAFASIRCKTFDRLNCSNELMSNTILHRHQERPLTPIHVPLSPPNGSIYQRKSPLQYKNDDTARLLLPRGVIASTEGEGFEPPGLLTQLFSRQPQ